MKPFEKAILPEPTPKQLEGWRQFAIAHNLSDEDLQRSIDEQYKYEVFINDLYQVSVKQIKNDDNFPLVHLSIKRRDKEPIHDWRDLQEIKNQLVGPECEAVELYPAESRLVDTANQYHLWCVADTGFRFPFGFDAGRVIDDNNYGAGAKQRGFNNE